MSTILNIPSCAPISTVVELTKWFEASFICMQGAPRAYFEIPLSETSVARIQYVAYGYVTSAMRNPERRLVSALRADFSELVDCHDSVLFWRSPIEVRCETEQQYGALLVTREQMQDGKVVPTSAVCSFDSGHWYENAGEVPRAYIYARLAIPALTWSKYASKLPVKPQGGAYRELP